ncbi:MAG: hypothetical protein LWX07_00655 [Bacteroidetes bacterium]|nr:hypothetical protein [Bacteroidota bacterium]
MIKSKGKMPAAILAAALLVNYALLAYGITAIIRQEKTTQPQPQVSNEEKILGNDNPFVQNNEDLINADYKNFYDDLKPYGTWVEVNLKNKSVESGAAEQDNLSETIRNVLGIKDAKADAGLGWSVFYVWRPSPNTAISIAAGDPAPAMYVPYTNGQWVYTDYGWNFRAATPYEELTHHYGRWVYTVPYGWIWVPGNRWAAAWVSWDYDDDYIAWTPGSPGIYLAVNYYGLPYRLEPNYVVCERRHFIDPYVYRYSGLYREHEFEKKYRDMESFSGNRYAGNKHFGFGPDPKRVEKDYGRKIEPIHLNSVSDRGKVKYGNKQFDVYAPRFKDKQNSFTDKKSGSERELKQYDRNSLSSGTGKKSADKLHGYNFRKGKNDKAVNLKNLNNGFDKSGRKENNAYNTGKSDNRRSHENYNWKNNRVDKTRNKNNIRRVPENIDKQNNRFNSGKQRGNENTLRQRGNGNNDTRSANKEQKGGQKGHR